MWCYKMFNMSKITRTKLSMLVVSVLLTIFTTIALYYTMTSSAVINIENGGDPVLLNLSMIFAVVIAFMWVMILIMFYEFKTDDILTTHLHKLDSQVTEIEEFKQMLKTTVFTPAVINPDVLKDGGVQGHVVTPK